MQPGLSPGAVPVPCEQQSRGAATNRFEAAAAPALRGTDLGSLCVDAEGRAQLRRSGAASGLW